MSQVFDLLYLEQVTVTHAFHPTDATERTKVHETHHCLGQYGKKATSAALARASRLINKRRNGHERQEERV